MSRLGGHYLHTRQVRVTSLRYDLDTHTRVPLGTRPGVPGISTTAVVRGLRATGLRVKML
eukprot:1218061-Rhodomonas_salina.1